VRVHPSAATTLLPAEQQLAAAVDGQFALWFQHLYAAERSTAQQEQTRRNEMLCENIVSKVFHLVTMHGQNFNYQVQKKFIQVT